MKIKLLIYDLLFHGCEANNPNMKYRKKSVSLFLSGYKIAKVLCYDNIKLKSKNKSIHTKNGFG